MRSSDGGSVEQLPRSTPTWRFLVCFTQIWISKSGQALPPFAPKVLEYFDFALHHPHQMNLAQFCAYHLREIIYNLDMITVARTTKLTEASKEKAKDESVERSHDQAVGVESEFYGGEQGQEPENEDLQGSETWGARFPLNRDALVDILSRRVEIASASKKGRKSAAVMQMKMFDNVLHEAMNARVQPNQVGPSDMQLSYTRASSINAALQHQEAVRKEMQALQ